MAFQGDSIYWVEVGKIVPNPFQPRREFNEAKLKELAESVRMYGILQPLTVTRNEIQEESGAFHTEYELIAGERRLRASKLAGLEQVPVIIRSGEDTEQEKLELAIIENLQREDLNAVDRALAFKQLAEVFSLSHAQVAKKVGRSRMYVSNSIRLLGLPDCILNSVVLGDISEGHARTLLMLKERPEEQDVVYREILMKKLSVREVERIARKIATDKVRKKQWKGTDAHLIEIEKQFTDTLGTRVQIAKTDFGGKVTIDYFSEEDLQKLLEIMQSQKVAEATKEMRETSQTVVRELSPEESVMAKLAQATPLVVVENEKEPMIQEAVAQETVSNTDNSLDADIISVPQAPSDHLPNIDSSAQDVEHIESVPASPEVSDFHPTPVPYTEDIQNEPISSPEHISIQEVAHADLSEEDIPEQMDTVTPSPVEHTSLYPQTAAEDIPPAEVQNKEIASVEEDTDISYEKRNSEFSFITRHTQESRKEDLVMPSDFEKTMFQDAPKSEIPEESHTNPSVLHNPETQTLAEKAQEELSQAVADKEIESQTTTTDTLTQEDDEDLYSIKNFSL